MKRKTETCCLFHSGEQNMTQQKCDDTRGNDDENEEGFFSQ